MFGREDSSRNIGIRHPWTNSMLSYYSELRAPAPQQHFLIILYFTLIIVNVSFFHFHGYFTILYSTCQCCGAP